MYQFLSFRDPDTNTNLGVCVIEAETKEDALDTAKNFGIAPKGEVLAYSMDKSMFDIQELQLNTLYSRQEMLDMGFKAGIKA